MREHVTRTWGRWDEPTQRASHDASFDVATHRIVRVDDHDAGLLAVEVDADHLRLAKRYLLPEARDHGVGALLLARVCERAAASGRSVRLRVLTVNAAAVRFYERHGFQVTGRTSERLFLAWSANDASRPGAVRRDARAA